MKILAALVTSFLINLVVAVIVAYIFTATVVNPNYLVKKADSTDTYPAIQAVLIDAAVAGIPDVEARQKTHDGLSQLITVAYVKKKVGELAASLDARLKGGKETPYLDVSDIKQQAEAAGLPFNDSDVPKRVTIPDALDRQMVVIYRLSLAIQFWAAILAGAIFLGLFLFAIRRREYKALLYFFFMVAASLGVLGAIFWFGPSWAFDTVLGLNQAGRSSAAPFFPLIEAMSLDIAKYLVWSAVLAAFSAVGVLALSLVSKAKTIQTKQPPIKEGPSPAAR